MNEQVARWVEAGKQVGRTFQYHVGGVAHWSSVAVQKLDDKYKVYVDEIMEAKMSAEEYERDELLTFDRLQEAADYINRHTRTRFDELRPCKGQRIFNPHLPTH